jgi:hypothetical protein
MVVAAAAVLHLVSTGYASIAYRQLQAAEISSRAVVHFALLAKVVSREVPSCILTEYDGHQPSPYVVTDSLDLVDRLNLRDLGEVCRRRSRPERPSASGLVSVQNLEYRLSHDK